MTGRTRPPRMGGTVTKTSSATLNGKYPGRDGQATVSNQGQTGVAHSRIFLVKNRLYQLFVIGTDSFVNSPDTAKFFDSFQIIGE
jgi:hypothetical protein